MHKLCNGKVPPLHALLLDETDKQIIADIENIKYVVESLIEQFKFREALFEVMDLARKGNQYMQKKEPWILAKNISVENHHQQLIDNCLHLCLQLTANLAILLHPFLPFTAERLCYMMKVVPKMLEWKNAGRIKLLSVGYSLREPQLLFRKIEDDEVNFQIEKLKKASENSSNNSSQQETALKQQGNEVKPQIEYGDFEKMDLRTGTIISAEKVEKADKLLQLKVDLGFETRTIVSGIAQHFSPEEIIGKQVVVVANLAPRKLKGIMSHGMLLMAEDNNGALHFIQPEGAITPGSTVS